jgi:hypothetical protein
MFNKFLSSITDDIEQTNTDFVGGFDTDFIDTEKMLYINNVKFGGIEDIEDNDEPKYGGEILYHFGGDGAINYDELSGDDNIVITGQDIDEIDGGDDFEGGYDEINGGEDFEGGDDEFEGGDDEFEGGYDGDNINVDNIVDDITGGVEELGLDYFIET